MTTPTITAEERENLRTIAKNATIGKPNGIASFVGGKMLVAYEFEAESIHAGDFQFFLHFSPANVLRLLDAIEAAEAWATSVQAQVSLLCPEIGTGIRADAREIGCALRGAKNRWRIRAEKAEAVSHILAIPACSDGCIRCPVTPSCGDYDESEASCVERVLEWAAQQAAEHTAKEPTNDRN